MIFVTVGTHEQPFNRLVEKVDLLKRENAIQEEVVIQTGFSTYIPQYCTWKKMFPYPDMLENVEKARIVITHGGPSSFIMPLQVGKIPIVVPRQKQFGEHVNDHQVDFVRQVQERMKNIIVLENIEELYEKISCYDQLIHSVDAKLQSNNAFFSSELEKIVEQMF